MAILLATDDVAKLFFDSAGDLAKQLLTVSTGIIGLSITFLKEVVKVTPKAGLWPLRCSWIVYLCSMICGFWTLMAVTGSIEHLLENKGSAPVIDNIRLPAALQVLSFVAATILLVIFGFIELRGVRKKSESQPGTELTGD